MCLLVCVLLLSYGFVLTAEIYSNGFTYRHASNRPGASPTTGHSPSPAPPDVQVHLMRLELSLC